MVQGTGTLAVSLMPGPALPQCLGKKKIPPVDDSRSKGVKARAIEFSNIKLEQETYTS